MLFDDTEKARIGLLADNQGLDWLRCREDPWLGGGGGGGGGAVEAKLGAVGNCEVPRNNIT